MDLFKNYESLWKSIIRPTRQTYNITDLGPNIMFTKEKKERVRRVDFDLPNKLGLVLKCSFFEFQERKEQQPPCVVYLHCNSGSRLEGQLYVDGLINKGLSVCVFDFAGSGQSEGEYISLGHFELGDVEVVVNYLKSTWQIPKIAIWGRSMGAVTGLMYISQDASIKAAVFDSPFSSFMKLAAEVGQQKTGLPKFLIKGALSLVQSTIQEKAGFDLSTLNVLPQIQNCKVPCLFVVSKKDNLISCHHSEKIRSVYTGESAISYFEGDHNEQRPIGVVKECINYFHARLIDNNLSERNHFPYPQLKDQIQQKLQQQTYQQPQQHPQVELPLQEQRFKLNNGHLPIKVIGSSCSQPGSTRAENSNISNYISTNTSNTFRLGQGTQEIKQPQQQQPSEFIVGSVHHAHSRSTTPTLKISFDRKPINNNIIHSESKIQNENMLPDFTPPAILSSKIPQVAQVLHTIKVPVPFQINYPADKQSSAMKSAIVSPTAEEAINQSKNISLFGKVTPSQHTQQSHQQISQQQSEPQTTDNTFVKTPLRVDLNANGRDRTRSTFSSAVEAFGISNSKTSSSLVPQPKLSDSPDFSKNKKSSHNEYLQQVQISQPSTQSSLVRQQQQYQEQLLSMPQGLKLKENPIINNQVYSQGIQYTQAALNKPKQIQPYEDLSKVSTGISNHFRQKSGVVSQHQPVQSNNQSTLPTESSSRYRSTTADQVPNISTEQNSTQLKVDAPQTRQPSPVVQPVNRLKIQNYQQPPAISKQVPFDSARKPTEESKFQNPTPLFNTNNSEKTTFRETLPVKKDENVPANVASNVQQVQKLNVISPRLDGSIMTGMTLNTTQNSQNNIRQDQTKNSIDFSKINNQFAPKEVKIPFGNNSSFNNINNNNNTPFSLQQQKQTSGLSIQSKNLAFLTGSKPHPSQSSNGKGKSLLNQTPLWLLTENNNTHSASIHTPYSKEANSNLNFTNGSNKIDGGNNQGFVAVNAFSFSENPQNSQFQNQNSFSLQQQSMQQAPLLSQRNEPKIMNSGKLSKLSPRADFASFWQPRNPVATEGSSINENQTLNSTTNNNNSTANSNNTNSNVNGRILQPQNLNILQDNHHSNNNNNSANIYKVPPVSFKYSNQSYSTPQTGQPQHLLQPSVSATVSSSSTSHQITTESKTFFPQKQPNKFDFKNKRSQNNVPIQRINYPKDENVSPLLEMPNSNITQNSFKHQNTESQSQNKMTASKTGAIANVPRETLAPFHWAQPQKNENTLMENKNNNQQIQVNINEQLQQLQDAEAIKKNRSSTTPTFKPDFIKNLQSTKVVHVLPNNSGEERETSPCFLKAPTAKIDASYNFGSIRQHQYSVHEINQASQTAQAFYKKPLYEHI